MGSCLPLKIVIGFVNILILLISGALFVAGVMVKAKSDYTEQLLDTALKALQDQASSLGFNSLDTSNLDLDALVGGLATGFIIVGIILVAISLIGLIGACCEMRCLLIVYTIILSVLFLLQIIFVGIAYKNRKLIDDWTKPELKDVIKNEYQGLNGSDVTSLVWNAFMIERGCCGVDSYEDFSGAKKWDLRTQKALVTPIACCKKRPTNEVELVCAKIPTDAISNYKVGCYDSLWEYVMNSSLAIGVIAGILALQEMNVPELQSL